MDASQNLTPLSAAGGSPVASYPASFAQQRLWILEHLHPGRAAYNEARVMRLVGALDIAALRSALGELAARHDSLRTRFAAVDGAPVQEVLPHVEIPLAVDDLCAQLTDRREALASEAACAAAERPFDMQVAPLLRVHLFRLAATEHLLLVVMHHAITDGWSTGIFWKELAALYAARVSGTDANLPALPIQYADYAVWQRQWLSGERLAGEVGYWREALAGMPVLELPADRVRPVVASFRGERVEFELPVALVGQLKGLARRERATLFMVLLAGFEVLLWRYSGQEDFGVGVPIAGRTRPELEGLIGFFVNTLVMRARLEGQPSFKEHLARVRQAALGAYEHQELPFDKLVEELNPPRDLSRNPLFEVSFAMQNVPRQRPQLGELLLEQKPLARAASKFDLLLVAEEDAGALRCSFQYATDLFDRDRIERMAGHYRVLLEAVVADPECSVAHLPLLTEAERQQLLVQWNDTAREYPRDRCVHQLVEEQVQRSPQAVAVVFGEQRLTYRQLDERANRLAHRLRQLGVGPEVLVAVCLERSPELVVGLLGILKAGGAYVPLDPGLPNERLAYMLKDSGVRLVVTQEQLVSRLLSCAQEVRFVTAECSGEDAGCIAPMPGEATAENLAYVIYTSGSTGKPKGVCIEHREVVNYLSWAAQAYRARGGSAAAVFTSIAFDLTITSVFVPLIRGGAVHLLSGVEETTSIVSTIRSSGLAYGLLKLTPTHLPFLQEQLTGSHEHALADVFVVGGEQLQAESIAFWRDSAPTTLIFNEYGPTETVVGCCVYAVSSQTPRRGPIPIGKPIANTRLYILDPFDGLAPVGVTGALHIAGDGVGRGYWNRPELTAERFVPDPFAAKPGGRMYRTGDLARYLPDGNIEFLGRRDSQVKLRGFRIELGEIESTICEHPDVREAVVLLCGTDDADKRLVAYLCPYQDKLLDIGAVSAWVRDRLPAYMVPSVWMAMARLPLTPNGKVDRTALPEPEGRTASGTPQPVIAPRNEAERMLARLWADVLRLDAARVGVDQDFFELGGNSLLAMQLLSRVRSLLGVTVAPRTVFDEPTIAGLARAIAAGVADSGPGAQEHASLPEILPRSKRRGGDGTDG
jgi:amino acid adenylation domain-containing protein